MNKAAPRINIINSNNVFSRYNKKSHETQLVSVMSLTLGLAFSALDGYKI